MKASARGLSTLCMLSLFAACSDSTSPSPIAIIEQFKRMGLEAARANDTRRSSFLFEAAAMLRFGAPISAITIKDTGAEHEYQAITVHLTREGSSAERTTLYAWRGATASSWLQVNVLGGFASFRPADTLGFVNNTRPNELHTGDRVWALEAGTAAALPTPDRGTCRPIASPTLITAPGALTCQLTRIDWSINAQIVGLLPVDFRGATSSILMRPQSVEGIHLILDCTIDCSFVISP